MAALALSGCSLGPEKPESIPPTRSTDTPDQGRIGAEITVKGEATELRVRVLRVLDPAPVSPADTTLAPRARFVGIALVLENIGDGVYSESPLQDSKLLTGGGKAADPVTLLGGPCARRFSTHLTLRPGASREGCVAFEVGPSERPTTFQFALDSGFAPEVGTWVLR